MVTVEGVLSLVCGIPKAGALRGMCRIVLATTLPLR